VNQRTASRLAWSIGLVSIVAMLAQLVLMFVDRHHPPPEGYSLGWTFASVLSSATNLLVPVIGVVLASRRRQNPIGWLFLTAGLALGLSGLGGMYAFHAIKVRDGALPGGRLAAWFSNWSWPIPFAMLEFLFLLFPTGQLPSPRWRVFAKLLGTSFLLMVIAAIAFATAIWSDPFRQSSNGSPFVILFVLLLLGFLGSGTAVVTRYRRSAGDERLQLKWFAAAAVLLITVIVASAFWEQTPPVVSVLQSLAFVFLWTSIGIAVLKYRLYDIDVVISKAAVFAMLGVFITAVYAALVVGVGTLVGNRQSPILTAVAVALIAVAFQPLRQRAARVANRLVYGERATPYEVLSDFADRMAGTYSVEDLLPRTARMIAEGTGAVRADVWLRVGKGLQAAGSWPVRPELAQVPLHGEEVTIRGATSVVPVRHRGDLLGAISMVKAPGDTITPTEAKLLDDVAAQAGLALRNARLVEDLRASRHRLVTAQDEERRRLERNIHDGAQQLLVALAMRLNLAELAVRSDPAKVQPMLEELKGNAQDALENLRDLARGIYPPLLADQGLVAALTAQARKSALPIRIEADGIGRFPKDAEAAVYFCTLEALQNVAKYAQSSAATVRLRDGDGQLAFTVSDDGVGFDPDTTSLGTGLQGMTDRLAALGGELRITSTPGDGTAVDGWVPVESQGSAGTNEKET
jgi:signal transduction histidine kinase